MEKKKNIIKLKVSETETIELDLNELEKKVGPSPKLEHAKLMASKYPFQIEKEKAQRKTV